MTENEWGVTGVSFISLNSLLNDKNNWLNAMLYNMLYTHYTILCEHYSEVHNLMYIAAIS